MSKANKDIQAMQAFVDTMVGIPKFSYPAKKDAPRPSDHFAHIQLLTETAVGLPYKKSIFESEDLTKYIIKSSSKLRYRIGIVETDGSASTSIMHGWTSEAMKSLMFNSGYGYIRCEPISIEDAKLEQFWETRQGLSVELYVERVYLETVDNIRNLVINGEYITSKFDSILMKIIINK